MDPLAPHMRTLLKRRTVQNVPAIGTGPAQRALHQITTLTAITSQASFQLHLLFAVDVAQFMTSGARVTQVLKASKTFFIRDRFQVFWIRGRNASQTKRFLFCECSSVRPTSSTRHAPAIHIQNHNRNSTTTTQCINQGKQTALKLTAFPSHLSGLNGFAGEHVISVE